MKRQHQVILVFLSFLLVACEKEELNIQEEPTAIPARISLNSCRFQASYVSTIIESEMVLNSGSFDEILLGRLKAIAHDSVRDIVYFSDWSNHSIRALKNGELYTFVGGSMGDQEGNGSSARLKFPSDIVLDKMGNLYVADNGNDKIRKITPDGDMTTYAGGNSSGNTDGFGSDALFNSPAGLAMDSNNTLYVSDLSNARIRVISSIGYVSTLAGSTAGFNDSDNPDLVQFRNPRGITLGPDGFLYLADYGNHKIRKINTATGATSTLAGRGEGKRDGVLAKATFNLPTDVIFDHLGNLFVLDSWNTRVRAISGGTVFTLAGSTGGYTDGRPEEAQFCNAQRFTIIDKDIWIADECNKALRKIAMQYACN